MLPAVSRRFRPSRTPLGLSIRTRAVPTCSAHRIRFRCTRKRAATRCLMISPVTSSATLPRSTSTGCSSSPSMGDCQKPARPGRVSGFAVHCRAGSSEMPAHGWALTYRDHWGCSRNGERDDRRYPPFLGAGGGQPNTYPVSSAASDSGLASLARPRGAGPWRGSVRIGMAFLDPKGRAASRPLPVVAQGGPMSRRLLLSLSSRSLTAPSGAVFFWNRGRVVPNWREADGRRRIVTGKGRDIWPPPTVNTHPPRAIDC